MSEVFNKEYSSFYDQVYGEKNYASECDLLENLFEKFGTTKPKSILDCGCGTGGHSILLSQRGYEITGIDRSPHMLAQAKIKAEKAEVSATFLESNLQEIAIDKKFDAIICMFAVICYQLTNEELEKALSAISNHLKPGGLFIFDFWYGPAVLSIRPETRERELEHNGVILKRKVTSKLNTRLHLCSSTFELQETKSGEIIKDTTEEHQMRYLFPEEIRYFLKHAGLEMLQLGSFPEIEKDATDETWNAITVTKKL